MSDAQLNTINAKTARQKWKDGRPVSLKEMAVALSVGYETVRTWKKMVGFPFAQRVIFPADFVEWRRARFGLKDQSHKAERPQPESAGKSCEPSNSHDSPTSLPLRAARLVGQGW